MDRIVCAAIRFEIPWGSSTRSVVIPSVRHYDTLMHRVVELTGIIDEALTEEQGFVDNHGTFLSREEALEVAYAAKQVKENKCSPTHKLFSEDLY